MAFHKSQSARRTWKSYGSFGRGGLTRKGFIRMMLDAVAYSAAAQAELDKKRAKKQAQERGDTVADE